MSTYTRTLSKSDFKLARECDAKLWFRENGFPDNREHDPYLQLLAEGGYMVEALATARYADGITLEYGSDHAQSFQQTLEYLKRPRVTLFQATLLHGRRLARVDILDKTGNTIRLIEVKAKSFDGAEHIASLMDGGKGVFRGSKKPHGVLSNWTEKIEDIAYQMILLERIAPGITIRPFLALVDKSKSSSLDNLPSLFEIERDSKKRLYSAHFNGTAEQLAALDLLTEVDVSEEVALVRAAVDEAAVHFETILDAPFSQSFASLGSKCRSCEFKASDPSAPNGFSQCWGTLASVEPHILELLDIGRVKAADKTPIIESLASQGKASLFDIPEDCLCKANGKIGPTATRQLRQIKQTMAGEPWIGSDLKANVATLTFPAHFIDFETSRLALPYHSGMRPYGQVTFQWSCHTVNAPASDPIHCDWLNITDSWPNKAFVDALRTSIGDSAKVVVWSAFEGSSLREILRDLVKFGLDDADTTAWITHLVDTRIVDLHDWARAAYYHPGMKGRTSIKVVMDALWKSDSTMREQFTSWTGLTANESDDPYSALPRLEIDGIPQNVREGTGAIRAYEAMMYGVEKHNPEVKELWCQLLKQYCHLDTLSMVLIFEHWRRVTSGDETSRNGQP